MSMLLPPTCSPATAPRSRQIRRTTTLLTSLFTLTAIIFLLLVLLGSTRANRVLGDIYFLRIDVSHIIPRSYPKAALVNSIAQTLGLRDFYQVGLWNYCEGYVDKGVTYCAPPRPLYSFDPVAILVSQLLAGAEIAVPPNIESALSMSGDVSHWMFGCFFVGIAFSAVSFVAGWLNYRSYRILPLLMALIAGTAALFTTIAAVIATALFCVFRRVFEDRPDLNIRGALGVKMFVFVWVAVGASAAAFMVNCWVCCAHRGALSPKRESYHKPVDGGESRGSAETDGDVGRGGSSGADTAVSSQAVVGEKLPLEQPSEEVEESEKLPEPPRPVRGRFEERFSVQGPYGS